MATRIKKIRLINFKRFQDFTIEPNERINVFVGDNESGKSTILEAIDLVSSCSIRKVESIGLDRLLNKKSVENFKHGNKSFDNLPLMTIELYLDLDEPDESLNGKNNTDRITCDGIRLVCSPNIDYSKEIVETLTEIEDYFPYEYYSIKFSTFAEDNYELKFKKKVHSVLIDSTNMNTDYATNNFVNHMYIQYTEDNIRERKYHIAEFNISRAKFTKKSLKELNKRIAVDSKYTFGLKTNGFNPLESNLMIYEDNVGIDSKGTGKQVFVKTDMALKRSGECIDVILIEEPENHLSPINLRKLINCITNTQKGQLFITTHNNMISTRLELKNVFMLHPDCSDKPSNFMELKDETAKYFMKAPPASIVEFSLARKVILVEGPSEYMLMEKFYKSINKGRTPEEDNVHIINVRGLSFKRYLEIATCTNCKVAVITDNDKDYKKHCNDKYDEFKQHKNIKIFYEKDNELSTFELVLYSVNSEKCKSLFGDNKAKEYMLNNKTEAAYTLLNLEEQIVVPRYIEKAIRWIKK